MTSKRVSDALSELSANAAAPRISFGELLDKLDDRGFGLLILAGAIPNAIPGPTIPGYSAVFSVWLIFIGIQLVIGRHKPFIPYRARRWSVTQVGFNRFLARALPLIRRVENRMRRRPSWFTGVEGQRLVGAVIVLVSLVLAFPIPFGNLPIAWSLIVLAFGLLAEDSRALLVGLGCGCLSLLWNGVIIAGGTIAWKDVLHYLA